MPDVTFLVSDLAGVEESEKLERALTRLDFVDLVNVDSERGLVAVSFEGGQSEIERIEDAIEEAGHDAEPSAHRGENPEDDGCHGGILVRRSVGSRESDGACTL